MPPPPAGALRAALLEPEGVLFDLRAARAGALRDALAGEGVGPDVPDAAALGRAAALPVDAAVRTAVALAAAAGDAAAAACDEVALGLAAHRAERAFADRLARGGVTLHEGAREAVAALGARLRLGVVTRLRRAEAERLLEAAALAPAFAFVVAADDRGRTPGAPGVRYPAALARLGRLLPAVAPGQVVAVVDGPDAAAEAGAAGLRTAVVGAAPGEADAPAALCAPAADARHTSADVAGPLRPGRGADVRLITLQGLTPAALACALDLAPTPCTPPRP